MRTQIFQRSLVQVGGVRPGAGTKKRNKRARKFGFADWPALLAHLMDKAGGDRGLFRRLLGGYL